VKKEFIFVIKNYFQIFDIEDQGLVLKFISLKFNAFLLNLT